MFVLPFLILSNDANPEQRCFLFLPHPFLHAMKELRCVILEEVELHHNGDAEQQLGIQRRPFEELIDMVAGARNLP